MCAVAYPGYVECGLVVSKQIMEGYGPSPWVERTLTCDGALMSSTLAVSNKNFTLSLQSSPDSPVDSYKVGETYDLKLPALFSTGQAVWDATGGDFSPKPAGVTETCSTTMYGACKARTVTWKAPALPPAGGINFTYICATGPASTVMIKSTFHEQSTGTSVVKNACKGTTDVVVAKTGCRNKNLVGSRAHEDTMYMALVACWVVAVWVYWYGEFKISNRKNLYRNPIGAFGFVLDGAFLYAGVRNATTNSDEDRTILYYAIGLYLLLRYMVLHRSNLVPSLGGIKGAKSVGYFTAVTFVVVSFMTSFHHWCNGEQDWATMSGDWGAFDSWQGTIPWWGLANVWAVYGAFPTSDYQLYLLWGVFFSIFASVLVGSIGGGDAYSDYCTWIQMFTCALVVAAWALLSIKAAKRSTEKPGKKKKAKADVLDAIGWSRIDYFKFAVVSGVVLIAFLASGSLTGKAVPIAMIVGVLIACMPLLVACTLLIAQKKVVPVNTETLEEQEEEEDRSTLLALCPRGLRF